MITLDDCFAFCEIPAVVVEKVAEEHGLPLVLACAYAHERLAGTADDRTAGACAPEPSRLAA
ncbi:hypothetical protein [Aromatoleum evansii]|uniref:hypothetical protein n=1 Tax=Aromatoleum evansii TaxID=59406 RepID=UPI00145C6FC0|nr:hypothetical protein [Aromatoleum evansii]NMG27951.1 hypothetical protein [Aromatoleum evansii]